MTDVELIARLAKRIVELELSNQDLEKRMADIQLHIICVGGPLNDNKLGYSRTQLVTFAKIMDLTE